MTNEDYEAARRRLLVERLESLTKSCPKSIWSASVQRTRQWKRDHAAALKSMKSAKSTNAQLQASITALESYE